METKLNKELTLKEKRRKLKKLKEILFENKDYWDQYTIGYTKKRIKLLQEIIKKEA